MRVPIFLLLLLEGLEYLRAKYQHRSEYIAGHMTFSDTIYSIPINLAFGSSESYITHW
jgi:hypothetical protein